MDRITKGCKAVSHRTVIRIGLHQQRGFHPHEEDIRHHFFLFISLSTLIRPVPPHLGKDKRSLPFYASAARIGGGCVTM